MDPSSTARSERTTAIVSTLVAIAILAAGVTAQQSRTAPTDDIVQLESDLRFQLENAFRHDAGERARRLAVLGEVIHHWQQAPRSEADRELLAGWLLDATIRSMPGSGESMPPVPEFGKHEVVPPLPPTDYVVEPDSAPIIPTKSITPTPAEPIASTSTFEPIVAAPRVATVTVDAIPVTAPFEPVALPQPVPAEEQAVINLTELAARIAGYHDGLDQIEARLRAHDSADLSVIAAQVKQLDEMTGDYRFVKLYYDALTDVERRTFVPLRSIEATLGEIDRQLDRSRPAPSADFLDDVDAIHRGQVDTLREQLSAIADRVVW